jgi:hypothetical protein
MAKVVKKLNKKTKRYYQKLFSKHLPIFLEDKGR